MNTNDYIHLHIHLNVAPAVFGRRMCEHILGIPIVNPVFNPLITQFHGFSAVETAVRVEAKKNVINMHIFHNLCIILFTSALFVVRIIS